MDETSPANKIDISIVVPSYNEEENILHLMEELSKMLDDTGMKAEVILVDDGSTDGTLQKALECEKNYDFLRVTSNKRNMGKTAALQKGYMEARGQIYVIFDADLQFDPFDIPRMVEKIDKGADIVTGWKQGKYQKRIVSFVYNYLSRKLFHIKVHDLNSMKVFKKEIIENLSLRKDWHRYLVVLAADKGYRVEEVKINLFPRKYGKAKYGGYWRIVVGALDLISVKFQISFMRKPMLLFGSAGGFFTLAGVIVGIIALYQRFILHHGYRPLGYLIVLLIVVGILFFVLGFLAEAIAGVQDELRRLEKK